MRCGRMKNIENTFKFYHSSINTVYLFKQGVRSLKDRGVRLECVRHIAELQCWVENHAPWNLRFSMLSSIEIYYWIMHAACLVVGQCQTGYNSSSASVQLFAKRCVINWKISLEYLLTEHAFSELVDSARSLMRQPSQMNRSCSGYTPQTSAATCAPPTKHDSWTAHRYASRQCNCIVRTFPSFCIHMQCRRSCQQSA